MTDIGRVGMVTKGAYNSASTYEALDVVNDNGGTYIAKQGVPAGIAPTNTTYWQPALVVSSQASGLQNWTSPENSSINGAYRAVRSNNVVTIQIYFNVLNANYTPNTKTKLFSIPSTFAPQWIESVNMSFLGAANDDSGNEIDPAWLIIEFDNGNNVYNVYFRAKEISQTTYTYVTSTFNYALV